MKRILSFLLMALLLSSSGASAQLACSYISTGAVLTAAQWNFCFSSKQNTLGFTPVNRAGDTLLGKITTFPSGLSAAGINLPPGAAPSAPVNGDMWTTSSGLFARINGATKGPFVDSASSPVVSVFGRTGAVAAATNDYSFSQISGSVAASQLPAPTLTTLGGVKSTTATSHQFLTALSTAGAFSQAQPAVADLSDGATGTGLVVLQTSPSLTTPTLGVASATTLNKLTITTPATGSTLTVANGKTLTASNTLTLTGTDGSSVALGTGGTIGAVGYATTGQIPGTATNDNASSGNIGEYIESEVLSGSAISLTTATAANITSLSLTAGDWEVSGTVVDSPSGATVVANLIAWVSSTSATLPTAPNKGAYAVVSNQGTAGASALPTGSRRFSVSVTTTVFLSAYSTFSGGTNQAYGIIKALRVR